MVSMSDRSNYCEEKSKTMSKNFDVAGMAARRVQPQVISFTASKGGSGRRVGHSQTVFDPLLFEAYETETED